ncbi:hypothetical protein C0J52_22791 [Blattella germanica]|nr:hypothetical protein C0J52_22791 [Blattella germanica]
MATSDYDKARLEDHQVIKISGIGQPEVGHFGDQSSGKFLILRSRLQAHKHPLMALVAHAVKAWV